MFTGIIETLATVVMLQRENTNLHITLQTPIASELKIDQSVAHNGVCLTVVAVHNDTYTVTAVSETLRTSNLGAIKIGDAVNLERSLKIGDRLDGHMVQGHIDTTALLENIQDENGSYLLTFSVDKKYAKYIVEKGSICLNGISVTVVQVIENVFSIAIIPFTWENTNLKQLHAGKAINVEFDVLAKYVEKLMNSR